MHFSDGREASNEPVETGGFFHKSMLDSMNWKIQTLQGNIRAVQEVLSNKVCFVLNGNSLSVVE